MVITDKTYTLKEFHDYVAQHPDHLLELIDGRIVEKVTTEEHGYIVINIGAELRAWVRQSGVQGYYSTEASIELPEDDKNHRRPDVSFRFTENLSIKGNLETMPDFCVEVRSPTNSPKELREKADFFIENGARLVWIVYPRKQIVEVISKAGEIDDLFVEGDVLTGGDVLPGFEMLVHEIFEH